MALAATDSKIDEILGILHNIGETGRHNDTALRKIKDELKKLQKQGDFLENVFTALGVIASFERDMDQMHLYYKNAMAYNENSFLVLANYSESLFQLSLYKESYRYALEAFKIRHDDARIISRLILLAYLLKNENDMKKHLQHYRKLYGEAHWSLFKPCLKIRNGSVSDQYSEQLSVMENYIQRCATGISECFKYPIITEIERMPAIDNTGDQWIAWILSTEDIDTGLNRMDRFYGWCFDDGVYKEDFNNCSFDIEFVEEE